MTSSRPATPKVFATATPSLACAGASRLEASALSGAAFVSRGAARIVWGSQNHAGHFVGGGSDIL